MLRPDLATETLRPLPTRVYRAGLIGIAAAALLVTAAVALQTGDWIGRAFPGFFVLPNRVIPSIGRDAWAGSRDGAVFQRTVVAVDGKRIFANSDAYRQATRHLPGTAIVYTLRHGATVETLALESRTFTVADYWLVFGGYLATGLLYLALAVLGAWLLPNASLGRALLLLGGTGGIFAVSGAGIYQADADLRVHALAEAFFPATLFYLALVCSRVERRWVETLGALVWWISLALAVPYQLLLDQPAAYSLVHTACEAYMGLAGLVVGGTLICARARAADQAGPLLRSAVAGALLGIGVPAVIMLLSGVSGGMMPVNLVTATAFLFPLCLAYGLLRERVFDSRPLATASAPA